MSRCSEWVKRAEKRAWGLGEEEEEEEEKDEMGEERQGCLGWYLPTLPCSQNEAKARCPEVRQSTIEVRSGTLGTWQYR